MLARLRDIFRAPEAKASRVAQLLQFDGGGRARWTPRDYSALTREGYVKNAVVHRCVRLVAESAASLTFLAYEGAAERDHHPLLELVSNPNPRQSGAGLFEAAYSSLLLAGNCYLEAVAVEGSVRELYALRADRVRAVPGPDGWPEAYEYTVAGRSIRFAQDAHPVPPILHLALFHPLDDHYGLAPLEAAAVAVELTLLECPGFAVIAGRAMWSGKAEIVNAIAALSGLLMTYMAARFGVLGVYVSGRSREKQAEVTGEAVPSLVAEIVKAMAKRK